MTAGVSSASRQSLPCAAEDPTLEIPTSNIIPAGPAVARGSLFLTRNRPVTPMHMRGRG
jgi:hypothetical protein